MLYGLFQRILYDVIGFATLPISLAILARAAQASRLHQLKNPRCYSCCNGVGSRLHAKAYIFDYTQMYDAAGRALPRTDPGVAIIGSSNFTLSGISHNTELNVVVHGKDNHERLTQWFEELWAESDDFDAALMAQLQQSWAVAPTTPYDIYMKTLYMLVRDRLEEAQQETFLWNDDITARLADFQRVAVRQAIQTITRYNGCFVADVVGLGKSYIGAAIVKHFERVERARPLIICPKPLLSMWERYNEIYQLNAHFLSMSMLRYGSTSFTILRCWKIWPRLSQLLHPSAMPSYSVCVLF